MPARPIKISLLNHGARKRRERAILNMLKEIDAYDAILYGSRELIYRHEWLTTFRVRPEELVRIWWEKDIARWMERRNAGIENWVETVAKPYFDEHERLDAAGAQPAEITNAIEALLAKLMPDALKRRL